MSIRLFLGALIFCLGFTTPVLSNAQNALPNLSPYDLIFTKSISGSTATSILFYNTYYDPVSIYWVNYSGVQVPYTSLEPGQSYLQPTYVTHPWVVTDAISGAYVVGYLPTVAPSEALIFGAGPAGAVPPEIPHIPNPNLTPLAKRIEMGIATAYSRALLAASGPECPPCIILSRLYAGIAAYIQASDPVDKNFQTIAQPVYTSLPSFASQSGLSQSALADLNLMQTVSLKMLGLVNAAEVSMNRADTANSLGMSGYRDLQLNAAASYVNQEIILAPEVSEAFERLSVSLPSSGYSGIGEELSSILAVGEPETHSLFVLGLFLIGFRVRMNPLSYRGSRQPLGSSSLAYAFHLRNCW